MLKNKYSLEIRSTWTMVKKYWQSKYLLDNGFFFFFFIYWFVRRIKAFTNNKVNNHSIFSKFFFRLNRPMFSIPVSLIWYWVELSSIYSFLMCHKKKETDASENQFSFLILPFSHSLTLSLVDKIWKNMINLSLSLSLFLAVKILKIKLQFSKMWNYFFLQVEKYLKKKFLYVQ